MAVGWADNGPGAELQPFTICPSVSPNVNLAQAVRAFLGSLGGTCERQFPTGRTERPHVLWKREFRCVDTNHVTTAVLRDGEKFMNF